MTLLDLILDLANLRQRDKRERRAFAIEMAEKQGELVEKTVGGLMKLARALMNPEVVDAVYDEELAPGVRPSSPAPEPPLSSLAHAAMESYRTEIIKAHASDMRMVSDLLKLSNETIAARDRTIVDLQKQLQIAYERGMPEGDRLS